MQNMHQIKKKCEMSDTIAETILPKVAKNDSQTHPSSNQNDDQTVQIPTVIQTPQQIQQNNTNIQNFDLGNMTLQPIGPNIPIDDDILLRVLDSFEKRIAQNDNLNNNY